MREEREKRRQEKKIKFIIKLSIFLVVVFLIVFLLKGSPFNVKNYEITGNVYYTEDEIMNMADCKTGGNIFIGTDYKEMKTRLSRDPYFEEIKISPKFPNTVMIKLVERAQVAGIVYGENFIVVDSDGIVLRKTSKEPKLTIIHGLTLTEITLGKIIGVEDEMLLDEALDIIKVMNENDMYFTNLEMCKGKITCNILELLTVTGTPTNIINSLKKGELQKVVSDLFERGVERGNVTVSGDDYISFSPRV